MSNESDPPAHTSPRQALLGIFILLQLGFLIVSNLLGLFKSLPDNLKDKPKALALVNQAAPGLADENTHLGNWIKQVETNNQRWIQLTGQYQDWALYTSAYKNTAFPAVALVWDETAWEAPIINGAYFAFDEKNGFHLCAPWNPAATRDLPIKVVNEIGILTATNPWEAMHLTAAARLRRDDKPERFVFLPSENEPTSIRDYVRFGKCRLRRYEGQFYLNLQPYEDETPVGLADRNTRQVASFAKTWREYMVAYMRYRLHIWREANPDVPLPKQVILFQQFYRIRGPADCKAETAEEKQRLEELRRKLVGEDPCRGWDGPILCPIMRWWPIPENLGLAGIPESFDFNEQRFTAIDPR